MPVHWSRSIAGTEITTRYSLLIEAGWNVKASVNWANIGSDNGLSPVWCQAIIRSNAGLLSREPSGIYFSKLESEIWIFLYMTMNLKMLSANAGQTISASMWQQSNKTEGTVYVTSAVSRAFQLRDSIIENFGPTSLRPPLIPNEWKFKMAILLCCRRHNFKIWVTMSDLNKLPMT